MPLNSSTSINLIHLAWRHETAARTGIGVATTIRNPLPTEAGAQLSARCPASVAAQRQTSAYIPLPAPRAPPLSARSLRLLSLCIVAGIFSPRSKLSGRLHATYLTVNPLNKHLHSVHCNPPSISFRRTCCMAGFAQGGQLLPTIAHHINIRVGTRCPPLPGFASLLAADIMIVGFPICVSLKSRS
jgi:hypothetical protein